MKKAIFLLLLPVFASAQTIVSDTSFLVTENGAQFYLTTTTFDNGVVQTVKQPKAVAESTALSDFRTSLANETSYMVNNCALVDEFSKRMRKIIKADAQLKNLTGTSVLDELENQYKAGFAGAWNLEQFKQASALTLSVNAQGRLRWAAGGRNGRVIVFAEGVIVLNNWQPNSDLALYSIKTGVWQNLDGTITIRR